jgi:hypothetical protein
MSRYEELAYLFTDEHRSECCDFANFLAGGLAEYLGCPKDKICFVSEAQKELIAAECTSSVAYQRCGFVHTTLGIVLPDELLPRPTMRAGINLQKIQEGFLVQITEKHGDYTLCRKNPKALHKFYESLFNRFAELQRGMVCSDV